MGNDIDIQRIRSSVGRRKLNSVADGILWYRFQQTDEILRLCENIFTEKENFVRLAE